MAHAVCSRSAALTWTCSATWVTRLLYTCHLQRHLDNQASAFVSFSGETARDLEAGEPAREESADANKISKISMYKNTIKLNASQSEAFERDNLVYI